MELLSSILRFPIEQQEPRWLSVHLRERQLCRRPIKKTNVGAVSQQIPYLLVYLFISSIQITTN